ncbi:hypothetical protein MUK42_37771 [Musa troglodytarum]|uniref:Uncharacterized protein n=1 Tax=Musa troglodytarum TaxID=320322 RepID=A0A9E7G5F5_9LILI|nr:hypothetical protein MUK42_37771 [Musa troglodytarum]
MRRALVNQEEASIQWVAVANSAVFKGMPVTFDAMLVIMNNINNHQGLSQDVPHQCGLEMV